ncbi:MAG: YdeI/OmpD-associated family protein [Polyangiaceae bacterium]
MTSNASDSLEPEAWPRTDSWVLLLIMPPVVIDPAKLRLFETQDAFEAWLSKHHDRETEIWIRYFKKGSGKTSIVYKEALDVALSWGWIDGQVKSLDETSYAQRFTPRRSKSIWSQINREHVARLEAAGKMTEHGRKQVEAAKADGRWDAAYASPSKMEIPDDLRAAIAAEPRASATFAALDKQNRYALAFRLTHVKTPEARARKIAGFVARLAEGKGPLDDSKWSPQNLKAAKKSATTKRAARPKKQ